MLMQFMMLQVALVFSIRSKSRIVCFSECIPVLPTACIDFFKTLSIICPGSIGECLQLTQNLWNFLTSLRHHLLVYTVCPVRGEAARSCIECEDCACVSQVVQSCTLEVMQLGLLYGVVHVE